MSNPCPTCGAPVLEVRHAQGVRSVLVEELELAGVDTYNAVQRFRPVHVCHRTIMVATGEDWQARLAAFREAFDRHVGGTSDGPTSPPYAGHADKPIDPDPDGRIAGFLDMDDRPLAERTAAELDPHREDGADLGPPATPNGPPETAPYQLELPTTKPKPKRRSRGRK